MREHEYQCVYKNDPIAIAMASQMQQINPKNNNNSPKAVVANPTAAPQAQIQASQTNNKPVIQNNPVATHPALNLLGNAASNQMQLYQNQLLLAQQQNLAQAQQQAKFLQMQQQAQLTDML